MKKFNKVSPMIILGFSKAIFVLSLLLIANTTPVSAHRSPDGCTGSGLQISLFSSVSQVHIGDNISYGVSIFNGIGNEPVVCDASNIEANIVTPDGITHPIVLLRTTLLNGESDLYSSVVNYTARIDDVTIDGALTASASDTGVIHQNDTDSSGGANQSLNTIVLSTPPIATLHIIKQVINDNGGTATESTFNLHVKLSETDVAGSPAVGVSNPGTSYSLSPGTYVVSEDADNSYTKSFSGDCDSNGILTLALGDDKTCTITNDDITPPVVPPTGGRTTSGSRPRPKPPTVDVLPIPEVLVTTIVPGFPKTGFGPNEVKNNLLNIVMLCGTLLLPVFIYTIARKKKYSKF